MSTTTPQPSGSDRPTWHNWAGNVSSAPARRVRPGTVAAVADAVTRAARDGLPVRCVGAGHSFSPVAATDGVQISLDDLAGIESISPRRDASGAPDGADVTVWAGTRLHQLGPLLWSLGLAMPNLGDFAEQSVAGAISTGTHGTGLGHGGLATAVVGLRIVDATGRVVEADAEHEPELFAAARVGLGALGVLVAVTLRCVPAFVLEAQEGPGRLSALLPDLAGFARSADHAEFYWFPHTDNVLLKRNTRRDAAEATRPLARWRTALDDELLSNEVFERVCRTVARRPGIAPRVNQLSSRALTARHYSDRSYSVFASPRRVRFREMEYALPADGAEGVLRELRTLLDGRGVTTPFPVEVRFAPADDVWLSTAHGREVCYVAVHQFHRMDHTEYFRRAEEVFRAAGGRPHWGKMHTLGADELRALYPRYDDFVRVRDRLDPERRFGNEHLERVLPR